MNLDLRLCMAIISAGMLSFFSPCVLPLLPVYFGYFSSDENTAKFPLVKRLEKTLAFVLGVSAVFFVMGIGAGFAGSFIQSSFFMLCCGIAVLVMGIYQIGVIRIPVLEQTKKLPSPVSPKSGLLGAFALGFFFSFGWSPCVGPILAMVLGISIEQGNAMLGGIMLLLYAAGFAVPFLFLAIGSQFVLKKNTPDLSASWKN